MSTEERRLVTDGFDELSKGLASGAISRRRALKLAGAGLLGGGLLAMFPGVAAAQVEAEVTSPGCRGERAINNEQCPRNRCGRRTGCFCARTVGGNKRCVRLNPNDPDCGTRRRCDENDDCAGDQICVKAGACPGCPNQGVCVETCGG